MNYNLLYSDDINMVDIKKLVATNRGLSADWCKKEFKMSSSWTQFNNIIQAVELLHQHIFEGFRSGLNEKIQIIVDCDMDGICSAAIIYKLIQKYVSKSSRNVVCTYSLHSSKQHGLSDDIEIDKDTTLVILPDAGSNDIDRCRELYQNNIDVLVLDHHIMEQYNPYAVVVNCMDGQFPNENLCGAAVALMFSWAFNTIMKRCLALEDWDADSNGYQAIYDSDIDLAAVATISDIMDVTNDDNMFLIQYGLKNIRNYALRAFLESQEIALNDVTIEHIKFKVAPLVSALIRMGSMDEKDLLFRAFIDDYEEFPYEKRGSLAVETENIYDRVVRLCKNAKSRQDRAKEKLLKESEVHEYPHVVLVDYKADKQSALTGLVASELANRYCKPVIVYHNIGKINPEGDDTYDSGSIRNYDGSPIVSLKKLLEEAFLNDCEVRGHDNAAGIQMVHCMPSTVAGLINDVLDENTFSKIGSKQYKVDFSAHSDEVDVAFIKDMAYFDNYSGFGFREVLVLVKGIMVDGDNFTTMGKNVFSWKISNDNVSYVKFKIPDDDSLRAAIDDIDFSDDKKVYEINAICSFGFNVYNGTIYAQGIVKDYEIVNTHVVSGDDEDDDLDFDF